MPVRIAAPEYSAANCRRPNAAQIATLDRPTSDYLAGIFFYFVITRIEEILSLQKKSFTLFRQHSGKIYVPFC
jgi:hypothetical protein